KTTIKYDLRTADNVHVSLYDEQGKFIRDIDNSFKAAERNSVEVNTTALVSGTYFVKFETSNGRIVSVKFVVKK
ncbi:MAG: T9SS type A sorting domain-containing protein, partial [Chlorobi bacterium]|nr:T9SS type A sorting domain-containing protein [Chlorobiota bacterium]